MFATYLELVLEVLSGRQGFDWLKRVFPVGRHHSTLRPNGWSYEEDLEPSWAGADMPVPGGE